MDIYITKMDTQQTLRIPMLPEEIRSESANQFTTHNVLQVGEIRIPAGTALDSYEWDSYFPGYGRMDGGFLRAWAPPRECDRFIQSLRAGQGNLPKARLMVTETNINADVYLDSYSPVETGGYGDIKYSIKFVTARGILIAKMVPEETKLQNAPPSDSPQRTDAQAQGAKTYTVAEGDTLWKIAQSVYGAGALYPLIYVANAATIGADPNVLQAGQVLAIP